MKKILLSMLTTALLFVSVSTQADEGKIIGTGTITFTGEIVEAPCVLTPNFENGNNYLSSSCYNSNIGEMQIENIDFNKLIKNKQTISDNRFTLTTKKLNDHVYIVNMVML